jgi:hypothetical protein
MGLRDEGMGEEDGATLVAEEEMVPFRRCVPSPVSDRTPTQTVSRVTSDRVSAFLETGAMHLQFQLRSGILASPQQLNAE